MTWDDFYDRYCDWSESTIKTRISSLEDIGAGEDVVDVVLNLSDEKLKVQLLRKAIKLDVNFTQDDFMNLDGELPGEVYAEVAKHGGFYLDNPYFNEHDFDWDEFYSECADLPVDMIKRCIPRIKKFGDSEEVKDAICWIDDTEAADALYDKAIASGVKFSTEQLEEMGRDDRLFLVDDINRIINMPDSEIEELGRAAQEAADNIDNMINHMEQNPKRQKRARFWGILLGIAAGLSKGSKKKRKHDGHCDGDCANCPPHYGYRYGRWYYGHGHNYGCVFGGNKGGGGPD